MTYLFEQNEHATFLLSTYDSKIIYYKKNGETLRRLRILNNDYQKELSAIRFFDMIYYTYVTKEEQIVVCNVSDANMRLLFSSHTFPRSHPMLLCFCDDLLLCYLQKNPQTGTETLILEPVLSRSTDPAHTPLREPCLLAGPYTHTPDVVPIVTQNHIVFSISNAAKHNLFIMDANYQTLPLGTTNEFSQPPAHSEENYNLLLAHSQKQGEQIRQLQSMIERATKQYNELMQVAKQYKSEAKKWRDKALHR